MRPSSVVLAVAMAIAVAGCKKQKRRGAEPSPSPTRAPGPLELTPAELPPCQGTTCLPDLVLDGHDGTRIETAGLRGQVVVLLFCAVWAGPCGPGAKELSALAQHHQDGGLRAVIMMVHEGLVDDLDNWGRRHGVSLPMVRTDDALLRKFGQINALPTWQLYGRDGHLVEMQTGAGADLEPQLTRALAAPFVWRRGPAAPTR